MARVMVTGYIIDLMMYLEYKILKILGQLFQVKIIKYTVRVGPITILFFQSINLGLMTSPDPIKLFSGVGPRRGGASRGGAGRAGRGGAERAGRAT